jgi:hypothetical protein
MYVLLEAMRVSYHTYYQAAALSLLPMGAISIWLSRRTRRLTPIIAAHLVTDIASWGSRGLTAGGAIMCSHGAGTALVLDRAAYRDSRRWQRVALGRDQVELVALAHSGDPRLDSLPQQNSKIGRLSASSWIKCGTVEDDSVRTGREHCRIPFAKCLVGQFKSVRHRHNRTIGRPLAGRGYRGRDETTRDQQRRRRHRSPRDGGVRRCVG